MIVRRNLPIRACLLVRMKIKSFLTKEKVLSTLEIIWKEEHGVIMITLTGEEYDVERMIEKIVRKDLTSSIGIIHNADQKTKEEKHIND